MTAYQRLILLAAIAALIVLTSGCSRDKNEADFEVKDFSPLSNYQSENSGIKTIAIDYGRVNSGFVIPSDSQTGNGKFRLSFKIRNTSKEAASYFFRLYYQNESYKFPEAKGRRQHPLAHENFYGSWEQTATHFIRTPEIAPDGRWHTVTADFVIQGNPRDDARFFSGDTNQRWKRNPRTGNYEFMLVVLNENAHEGLPDGVQKIGTDERGAYTHPFYYFLHGRGASLRGCRVLHQPAALKVHARPPFNKGIYAEAADFYNPSADYVSQFCGSDSIKRNMAALRHFIHYVDESSAFSNVPVKADVPGGKYSLTEYNLNRVFTPAGKRIRIKPATASCPCENTGTDSSGDYVYITNKAGADDKMQKQSAGIITRHGFSYGTYTVKIDFPPMLGADGIWNGLTYAVWLITQSDQPWNNRRPCRKQGYLPRYWGGGDEKRNALTAYSEIDFEILKTSAWCPNGSAPPALYVASADRSSRKNWDVPLPGGNSDEIMVCCTNWDMACPEPGNFGVGCQKMLYDGKSFYSHRWDHSYRAVTQKTPAQDKELFGGGAYYFQIIWKPEEIIWKIGKEKENMRVVAYMNSSMTSIPGNQMLLIVSSEFHNSRWWPGSPFRQDDIPFPLRDITGRILEITIE